MIVTAEFDVRCDKRARRVDSEVRRSVCGEGLRSMFTTREINKGTEVIQEDYKNLVPEKKSE